MAAFHRRLFPRIADALLGTDRRQRVRVLHTLIAMGILSIGGLAIGWLVHAGIAPARPVAAWAAVTFTGFGTFYALLRSGASRYFADPSLTLPQILFAVLSCAVVYALAGPARGGVFPLLMVAVVFGMFRLSPRTVLRIGIFAVLLFAAVGTTMVRREPARYLADVERVHLFLLAGRDELTGLPNRRRMNQLMEQELRRSSRAGTTFCLVLIDIDHFKRINDTYGHAFGDEVLRAFARIAAGAIRQTDVLARWGGEEFALMLPDTGLHAAVDATDRLRAGIEAAVLDVGGRPISLTVSAGVGEHASPEPWAATLDRADRALYRAKAAGRNRVLAA